MSAATGPLQYSLTPSESSQMASSSSASSSPSMSHSPSPTPHAHHSHSGSSTSPSAFTTVVHHSSPHHPASPYHPQAHLHPHPASPSPVSPHPSHPQVHPTGSPTSPSPSPHAHLSLSPSTAPISRRPSPAPTPQYTPFPFPNTLPLPPRSPFPTQRYVKVRTIRKTLFGKVVLYQDTLTSRLVAIKLSDRSLLERGTTTSGNKVAEDPQEEIRTMNILSGNIRNMSGMRREDLSEEVRRGERYVLTSLGEYEDSLYLYTVMPFCSKGEFFDLVCHETRFGEEKAKKYFLQMVLGVSYMHALGMVHLDLSLENLLMTDEDELKICDYGVTRHLAYSATNPLVPLPFAPSTTNKPGKMGYMSPEIFSSRAFSGPLADVWSMGIVLFIALFGVPPYQIPAPSDQRFALIFSGQIWRLLGAWRMTEVASKEAVDLIGRMLSEESKRITVEEILRHPWLKSVRGVKDNSQAIYDEGYAKQQAGEKKQQEVISGGGRMETQ